MPPDTQGLPWPEGEPEAARAAARRATGLASALNGVRSTVGATDAPGWSGSAASAFDGAVQRDAMAVATAAGALDQAAGALNGVAGVLETAQERVLEAARRLKETRDAAQAAATRAGDARAAATSAHAAAALDLSAPLGGSPLLAQAGAAEDAAQRAEAASATAQAELARVQGWAQRQAHDAVHDAQAADRRTAGELDAAAQGAAPFGVGTGIPAAGLAGGAGLATMAGMGPLGPLGQYLNGDLLNYWSGGPGHQYFPYGSAAKSAAFMYGTAKWMPNWYAWQSWERAAGPGGLTAFARAQTFERLPTFNNGLIGRGLARGMSRVPALEGAGGWLGDASRATPFFRGLGIAGGVVSTGIDGYGLIKQGNPIDAYDRRGAGYVADIGRTAFSASTTAFLIAPNPVTGGAVVVSGAVWLGAEGWEHREQIAHAVSAGADYAWDHSLPGLAWNNRAEIGAALDQGVDTIGNGLSAGAHGLADAGGKVLEGAGNVIDDLNPF